MTVNKCTLIGNLGKDAEIRNTGGGMAIANLRQEGQDAVHRGPHPNPRVHR